ncbi:hypothetical protein F5B20DRAFT_233453 [Whalleya microplaca]|nr:hypothetical protein F5B20DRAFT_233453 [Whalleya microplaca]
MAAYGPTQVIPVYSSLLAVSVVLTGLRLWVRMWYTRSVIGADDIVMVVGMLFVSALTGMQIWNSLYGTGGNIVDPNDKEQAIRSMHIDWTMPLLEPIAFGLIKLSLLLFYRRIFGVWEHFRLVNSILIGLIIAWAASFFMAMLFICHTDFELLWRLDPQPARDHCNRRGLQLFAFAITSVITDILVVGLPIFFIGRLQMPKRKKFATAVVFALGFASTGACILRLLYVSAAFSVGRLEFAFKPGPGETKAASRIFKTLNPTFLTMVELCLGTWGANLPALSPLMRSVHPLHLASNVYRMTRSRLSSTTTRQRTQGTQATQGSQLPDSHDTAPIIMNRLDSAKYSSNNTASISSMSAC